MRRSELSATLNDQKQEALKQQIEQLVEEIEDLKDVISQGISYIQNTNVYIETIAQLNADIRSSLTEMESKIQELQLMAEQLSSDEILSKQMRLSEYVTKADELIRILNELKFKQRKANVIYQQKAQYLYRKMMRERLLKLSAQEEEQEEIAKIGSSPLKKRGSIPSNSTGSAGDILYKSGTNNITKSLMKTRELLSSQLSSTANSMAQLSSSHQYLKKAIEAQRVYEQEVKSSGALIRFLHWQEKYEHYMILAAFIFFCLVCLYVFNKRIPVITFSFRIIWWLFSWIPYLLFASTTDSGNSPSHVPAQ